MLQLRNLINRRNVGRNVFSHFNASVDIFKLRTGLYLFFGMKDFESAPSQNFLPDNINRLPQQAEIIGKFIDRFVTVWDYVSFLNSSGNSSGSFSNVPLEDTSAFTKNPHCERIYCYGRVVDSSVSLILPQWLQALTLSSASADNVFSYACTLLSDGLLLLELRDAIYQVDG